MIGKQVIKMSNFRWTICAMLFFATTINYMDRQVLSLTWKDFISPEFGWTDKDYGTITAIFSIVYAISLLFVGKFIDKLGTLKGYLLAIGLWSFGACVHAFCGIATNGVVSGNWLFTFESARVNLANIKAAGNIATTISTVSVWLFLSARCILAIGESGNFPSAIKITAEYFPKKARGFATGIFNSGAQIGALLAPFVIPLIARYCGWEMSFLIIGAIGFIWMGGWVFIYDNPRNSKYVNKAELEYIEQDTTVEKTEKEVSDSGPHIGLWKCFSFRQTWAVIAGRFLPDGVWWFFLFWAPAYVKDVCHHRSDDITAMMMIFTLYVISMLSIVACYLPTWYIEKKGMNPYNGRMKAMLIFAFFPLLGLIAQPAFYIWEWFPIIIIGIIAAAHQSWSANVYTVVSDMFPKSVIATVTGIGGMAGGIGSMLFNYGSGVLFRYSKVHGMDLFGYHGIDAGYMIVFIIAALAYIVSWVVIKILVPKYKLIVVK